jgi:4-amino-4-deoxy-L-arabinose transferase-like glycosyltransferase
VIPATTSDSPLGQTCAVLSVVVPARDEAPNLRRLVDEVRAALDPLGMPWELVVVDDGSIDETPAVLAALAAREPRVRALRLDVSRGQTGALLAGFRAARGDYIATLDADLQCAPADLPPLVAALRDADLACGIRSGRHDPFSRRIASALSNAARRLLVAPRVRDLACPVRVFRATALAEVERMTPLFGGAHRWLPALFTLAGLRVVQRPVVHRPRLAGTSKYTTRGRVLPVLRELRQVVRVTLRRSSRARTLAVVAALAVLSVPFLCGLGSWPLIEPDEGRNAEIAREMLVNAQWSVPHFNGLPYLDKPVLLFWMIAGAFRAFGVSEAAARLPSAIAGVATIVLTFDLARLLLGPRRALLAAAVVATSPIVLAYGRLVIFDLPLTALVTAALCCLVHARLGGSRRVWLPLAGLAMGLAVLTKGPVGIAVPLLAWLAGRGALPRHDRATLAPSLVAVAVIALVVAPWVVLVARQEPRFLHYALVDETVLRLTSSEQFHRSAPVYFYLETLAWALGLWGLVLVGLAPLLVRRDRLPGADRAVAAFALRAVVALLVFFTLSASKRPHYILPAVVPLALLVAIAADVDHARTVRVLRATARWIGVAGAIALAAALAGFHASGDFDMFSRHLLVAVGVLFVAWAGVTLALGRRVALALACAAAFAPALGFALVDPLTAYAEAHSARALAARVDRSPVVFFETFRTSLPFYLGQPVPLVSTVPSFTSNYLRAEPTRARSGQFVSPDALRVLMAGADPPVVVVSRWRAARLTRLSPRPLYPLYTDHQSVLFGPKG